MQYRQVTRVEWLTESNITSLSYLRTSYCPSGTLPSGLYPLTFPAVVRPHPWRRRARKSCTGAGVPVSRELESELLRPLEEVVEADPRRCVSYGGLSSADPRSDLFSRP